MLLTTTLNCLPYLRTPGFYLFITSPSHFAFPEILVLQWGRQWCSPSRVHWKTGRVTSPMQREEEAPCCQPQPVISPLETLLSDRGGSISAYKWDDLPVKTLRTNNRLAWVRVHPVYVKSLHFLECLQTQGMYQLAGCSSSIQLNFCEPLKHHILGCRLLLSLPSAYLKPQYVLSDAQLSLHCFFLNKMFTVRRETVREKLHLPTPLKVQDVRVHLRQNPLIHKITF